VNLSVVIPAYRNLQDILTCLNSLQATATDYRAIQWAVQDDCSDNMDLRFLIPPYVAAVERNPVNRGFAGNCNAGAARAAGDVIAFVNQDIVADGNMSRGWDATILAAFEDSSVGIVAPRLLFPDGKIQSAGGEFDNRLQPHHRCLGYSDLTNWEVNTPQSVSWATGAFLAIRREVFQQIGGFDEAYAGGYFEDVELCLRVRELGLKVWYEPRTSLVHKVGTSGGNPNFMRNASLFRERWVVPRKIQADVNAVLERWW
jgi:GT2 family glycosyltransferase